MKKIAHRMFSFISALAMTISMFSSVLAFHAPAPAAPIYRHLSAANSTGWSFETSGPMETITPTTDGWVMQAGGDSAFTHYSRVKYKLPEGAGVLFTSFHARAVVVLPADFYTQQKAGFRILNTDNYQTTLNGTSVGASNANELRVSVSIYSDHKLRVLVAHETGTKLELYVAPTILPTGEHTFELAGDVARNAPWYFKVDGIIVASGIQRLSTDDMADSERVITRIVAGIDGAADQTNNSMNLLVKSLEIANYDIAGSTATSVPPTATLTSTLMASPTATKSFTPTPTATAIAVLPTFTATASPLPVLPTATRTLVPTVISQPATPIIVSNGKNSLDIRVASGNDDVEESSSGEMYVNSTDLELIYDDSAQVVGVRFTGVKIPRQATITNAYIQFKVDETSSKTIKLTISGEAIANASSFANSARNISLRQRTSNKVAWSPSSWLNVGVMGKSQRTPNLKSIVQEIVNQSNWNPGNSLVMIITGTSGKRVAESFEGDAAGAPLLHVEFSIPTQTAVIPPTATLTATATTTATLMTPLVTPTTIPATFTPQPTQIIPSPTMAATETQIVLPTPTDTPVPTLIQPSPTVEVVVPTETPLPAVP